MSSAGYSRRKFLISGAASGAGAVAVAGLPPVTRDPAPTNVRHLGAKGDGITDDSAAFQAALDRFGAAGGGALLIPAGRYRIGRPLKAKSASRLSLIGEGPVSRLLMTLDAPILQFDENTLCEGLLVSNLAIDSVGEKKSPSTPAIALDGGMGGTTFENVLFDGRSVPLGGAVRVGMTADTSAFVNCQSWLTTGAAFEFGVGAEVRFTGGRIIGDNRQREGSIGILLKGNMGGFHVLTTDIIHHHTCLQLGTATGIHDRPSNREIFLTQATLDSAVYGLRVWDSSYVSIAGVWAASSDEAQIQIEESATNALVVCNGGTIFNGGAYGRKGSKNGFVALAGSFNLCGVEIRNNQGTGILSGPKTQHGVITGCRIRDNGTAGVVRGEGHLLASNNVFANAHPLRFATG